MHDTKVSGAGTRLTRWSFSFALAFIAISAIFRFASSFRASIISSVLPCTICRTELKCVSPNRRVGAMHAHKEAPFSTQWLQVPTKSCVWVLPTIIRAAGPQMQAVNYRSSEAQVDVCVSGPFECVDEQIPRSYNPRRRMLEAWPAQLLLACAQLPQVMASTAAVNQNV